MDKKKSKRIKLVAAGLGCAYLGLKALAFLTREKASIDDDNPYLSSSSDNDRAKRRETIYERFVKPELDSVLSFCGMVVLLPVYAVTAAAVYLDDPGPVFFSQKRIGKDKHYFMLHKFRTMRMDAPHDTPTHMLSNPEQYITRVGRFMRQYSVDELAQLWDCYRKKISLVGPRPALWNQADLIAERDKYGANDVKPGITGLAQINGRDELSIEEKASLDGDYARNLSPTTDFKCLLGTVQAVIKSDGVVEGGTGIKTTGGGSYPLRPDVPEKDPTPDWGFKKIFKINYDAHKRILITGEGSYIGEYFKRYALEHYGHSFTVDTVSVRGEDWKKLDFGNYDCVFHVAGIAHADTGKVSEEEKEAYYQINTDLAIEAAKKAKSEGVGQFVFMSSMIVYGNVEYINEYTQPAPSNFYGDSKWQADKGLRALASDSFQVAVLRPPMIYGKGSKGNYPKLAMLAVKLPVFPDVNNQRSMLYIENFCEFLCILILTGQGGIFCPQNAEYTGTTQTVRLVAQNHGHKITTLRFMNIIVYLSRRIPGRFGNMTEKAFGNACYDKRLSSYSFDYQRFNFTETIKRTENQ